MQQYKQEPRLTVVCKEIEQKMAAIQNQRLLPTDEEMNNGDINQRHMEISMPGCDPSRVRAGCFFHSGIWIPQRMFESSPSHSVPTIAGINH